MSAAAPLDEATRMWRRRVFVATWLCYFSVYFCRKPFYIVKGEMGRDLGVDATTLGDVGAAYLVAYAIGQYSAGLLGTRFGARGVLLLGAAVSILANIGFGFATGASILVVFMVANGLAQGTAWPTLVGTMASWFRREERGRVMGVWATNFQAGGVAANALAAFMLGAYGWRSAYFAGAAVLASAWWLVFLWQRDTPEDAGLPPLVDEREPAATDDDASPWPAGAAANVALVSAFYFCVKFVRYALWSWAPFFLAKNFGLKGDEAGFASTAFDVAGIFGVLATGWLSDRVFKGRRAGVCLAMMVAMTASCGLLYAWGATSPAAFAICIALVGFTLYGPDALLTSAGAMDIGSKKRALLAAGIINGTGSLGSVVQELVVGRAYDLKGGDVGVALGFLFVASLGATAALAVVVVRNRMGRSDV